LLNSALETALNRISLDWHPLIKKAKDISSAAVMLAIVNAVIVWGIIIWSH
jgi:diacylglycerol kinase (ATP)